MKIKKTLKRINKEYALRFKVAKKEYVSNIPDILLGNKSYQAHQAHVKNGTNKKFVKLSKRMLARMQSDIEKIPFHKTKLCSNLAKEQNRKIDNAKEEYKKQPKISNRVQRSQSLLTEVNDIRVENNHSSITDTMWDRWFDEYGTFRLKESVKYTLFRIVMLIAASRLIFEKGVGDTLRNIKKERGDVFSVMWINHYIKEDGLRVDGYWRFKTSYNYPDQYQTFKKLPKNEQEKTIYLR